MTDANTFSIQGSQIASLTLGDLTGTQSFTFPDQSGTLALTSDLPDISGKADVNLGNLVVTAINTSLISDTDSTDNLGSSSIYWANTYTDKIFLNSTATLDGSVAGTTTIVGSVNVDSNTLYVDSVNDKVGIGTNTFGGGDKFLVQTDTTNGISLKYFVNGSSGGNWRTYKGRGTGADPRRVRSGDVLTGFNGFGYYAADDSSTATAPSSANAQFQFATTEAFTSTGQGTYFNMKLTPTGSTTLTEIWRVLPTGELKLGGTAVRGTTVGTNHLDIFDGTAPVGTLTNGISIYSSSGEGYMMDAAGNATLQTPHDDEGNWIFYSKNTKTGKVLRIDMEKMMKFLNEEFGTDFIQEYFEATNYPGQNNQHINKITN